jgi:hypothetical protein
LKFGQSLNSIFFNVVPFWAKDAGFVYESLRIETNQVIGDFCFHKTNPQNKSLRFGFASPKLKDLDSQISTFKDLFRAIVLRIRKDS